MSEITNSNGQNPSGVWQGLWGSLFMQFNIQMTEHNYLAAWTTLGLMRVEIPTDCQQCIEEEYSKVEKIINKTTTGYNTVERQRRKLIQLNNEAPIALRNLLGKITKSLYDGGWINKADFTGKPKYGKKGHL
jgi:gentisate 1,2-dioxygenase